MPSLIDLTGKKFGKLTVLEKAPSRNRKVYWKCQCDCGNIIETRGDRLKEGRVKSCGCYSIEKIQAIGHKNEKNLLGQKFNKLTVLERSPSIHKDHCAYWICKCDCGNIVEVSGTNLRTGNTKSCGCLKSIGEQTIQKILQENNISYKKEYTFNDLIGKSNKGHLKFDFAIFDKENKLICLIEYQGIQHYSKDNKWYRPEADLLKKQYCQNNNILLIEIKYSELSKLSWSYLQEKIYDR